MRKKESFIKEVSKGVWGMPRLSEAKKDVISCEKLRGSANSYWSVDVRMGQPSVLKTHYSKQLESKPRELKHLSTWRRRKQSSDCASSGERTRRSPNLYSYGCIGVIGPHNWSDFNLNDMGRSAIEGDSPVRVHNRGEVVSWVGRGRRRPVWICQHHLVRLNTPERPIVNQYCEGKVKSTVNNGVK